MHDGITPPLGVYSPYIFAGVSPLDPVGYPSPHPSIPEGFDVEQGEREGKEIERRRKRERDKEIDLGKPRARAEYFGLAKICREFAPSTRYHFSSGVARFDKYGTIVTFCGGQASGEHCLMAIIRSLITRLTFMMGFLLFKKKCLLSK